MKFVVCNSREDCGEDYLYPAGLFETVEMQEQTAIRMHALLAA